MNAPLPSHVGVLRSRPQFSSSIFKAAALLFAAHFTFAASLAESVPPRTAQLSGTQPLEWPEADLSTRLMDGAHLFAERKIAESVEKRAAFWSRDFSSAEAYAKSIEPNRAHFQTILGVVDLRLPAAMERYGDEPRPALVAETAKYRVWQVRWPVLEGLWGSGLLVEPRTIAIAQAVLVPDAGQTPEQYLGLAPGLPAAAQTARRLAENGFQLVIPIPISREKLTTEDVQLRASDQTHREWIYRQAFHMGRHVIGYEVQTVLAAADWLRTQHGSELPQGKSATSPRENGGGLPLGVLGFAEGGLTAFYSAALNTRFTAALVSGYFDSRQHVASEPIDRNVWSLLREFGDAEIASLILPRALVIEHCAVPDITGQKGEWHTPDFASVQAEVQRIATGALFAKPALVQSTASAFSDAALETFTSKLGVEKLAQLSAEIPADRRTAFDPTAREARYFHEMERHVQTLLQASDQFRDASFLFKIMPELADNTWSMARRHPVRDAEKFIEGAKPFRERFRDEAMGRFDEPLLPFHARTRKIAETAKWTAYDVVLDVWP